MNDATGSISMQSENVNELATALAKAQSQIVGAVKDSANPFFKSKYADLASCWDACRKQLTDNGLSVIQTTDVRDGEVLIVTTLAHASGQWMRGVLPVKAKDESPQAQGSGITYARRYALAAIVGIAQVDDDAEAAQGRVSEHTGHNTEKGKFTKKVNEYADRIKKAVDASNDQALREIQAEVREGGEDFRIAVWASLPTAIQTYITSRFPKAA